MINKVGSYLYFFFRASQLSKKIDIAEYVNASLEVMQRDARLMRGDGPTVFTSIKKGQGVEDVVELILAAWRTAGSPGIPGPVVL